MTLPWPPSHPGAYRRGGDSGTPASCLGWRGHCLTFGSWTVRTPRLGMAPRQIEFHWWDMRLGWLFIVLLRVGYANLGVHLHLPYVTWHSFYWSSLSRKSLSFHKAWQLPCSAADLPQFEKQLVFWLHLKEVWGECMGEGLAVNIFVGRAPTGSSDSGFLLGSRALTQKVFCSFSFPLPSSSSVMTANHVFLLECVHQCLLFLKGGTFVYIYVEEQISKQTPSNYYFLKKYFMFLIVNCNV